MRAGLTIGEFAQLTHLSVRTLRRYHGGGLLHPARVDPDSGYRYYTSEQIPTAQVIYRLRELGMPLTEVGEVLATGDPDVRADLIDQPTEIVAMKVGPRRLNANVFEEAMNAVAGP